jgi:hypothetical protein
VQQRVVELPGVLQKGEVADFGQNQFTRSGNERGHMISILPLDDLCLANCNFKPQDMSQCYTPPLYGIHFEGGLNSGEAQV